MALNKATFETIKPFQFTVFTFPNPHDPTSLLRIAVLDSPVQPTNPPRVAAMLVPSRRESDWVFSTESGHLQLLLNSSGISRLILAGDSRPSPQIYRRPSEDDLSFRSMNSLLEEHSWIP